MLGMTHSPTPPAAPPGPVEFDYTARLAPLAVLLDENLLDPQPSSWFVTFGFGKPAASTYTEVAFTDDALGRIEGTTNDTLPERVLDEVVRTIAADLYGTAWAFHYRPDQYQDAIARHGVRLRERVVVSSIEVWT